MNNNVTPIVGYLSVFTLLTIFIFSCRKNTVEPPDIDSKKQGAVYEYIKKLGYTDSEIQDLGDAFVVDGDILFEKNSQPDLSIFNRPKTEQYGSGNFVGYFEQPNIVLLIDSSLWNFQTEINAAVAMWNVVPNCRIDITTTILPSAEYDITISNADLVNSCGASSFPMNGRAGREIKIDLGVVSGYSMDQWKSLVAHLIGHCIGLRHTNWISLNESQQLTDQFGAHVSAMHILGTPTGDDPFSVMNGGTCGSDNKLSNEDILTIQFLYPENPPVAGTVPVFRYYNNIETQDHFYTKTYSELGDGSNNGYVFEGIAFFAFPTQVANSVPVHRWYRPSTGNHFYSTAPNEIPDQSIYEGEAFFVYPSAINGAAPVYRYYHGVHDDHFYTKNNNEIALATGYNFEFVSWYAY